MPNQTVFPSSGIVLGQLPEINSFSPDEDAPRISARTGPESLPSRAYSLSLSHSHSQSYPHLGPHPHLEPHSISYPQCSKSDRFPASYNNSSAKAENLLNQPSMQTIYYRLSHDAHTTYILPQVFRMALGKGKGEEKMNVLVYGDKKAGEAVKYRVHVSIQLSPFFHPKAKKDLHAHLFALADGNPQPIAQYILGSYTATSFQMKDEFQDIKARLYTPTAETLSDNEDPVEGFSLTFDCSLESFKTFKERISKGREVGKILFELKEECPQGQGKSKIQAVPVHMNLRKVVTEPLMAFPVV